MCFFFSEYSAGGLSFGTKVFKVLASRASASSSTLDPSEAGKEWKRAVEIDDHIMTSGEHTGDVIHHSADVGETRTPAQYGNERARLGDGGGEGVVVRFWRTSCVEETLDAVDGEGW